MRNDLSQGFLDAVAIGDCDRYCVIYINGEPKYFAQTELQIEAEIIAVPAVSKWGRKTVGTDLNASVNSISIPAVDRSVSLINSEEFGWIGREFVRRTQEGKRIDFRIIANGEDILEDSLVIKEPISYSQGDAEILVSCVSAMVSRDPLVGTFDPSVQAYSSVSVGSIGNAVGSLRDDLSAPYCKLSATAISGATSMTCDRDLIEAGFDIAGGTINIDYETISYSSISGTGNNILNLSAPLSGTHLKDQYVCVDGGSYFYDYGPGPVEVVGALMVKGEDGTFSPYTGSYSVVNGARLLMEFVGHLPYYRKNGTVESSVTKSWLASDFDIYVNPAVVWQSGSEFYWSGAVTAGQIVADLTGIYVPLPAGAVFSKGTTSINFTFKSNSVVVRSTKTQVRGEGGFNLSYSSYVSGEMIYADNGSHALAAGADTVFARLNPFTISAPAGSTFVSGSVYFSFLIGYGQGTGVWSFGMGNAGGSSVTFGSSTSSANFYTISKTYSCSTLNVVNSTSLVLHVKNTTSSPKSLPVACASIGTVLAEATFDTTVTNAIYGYGTIRLHGVNYQGSRNISSTTSDYNQYIDSKITLNVESSYSKPAVAVASIGSISSTIYYVAEAPGFPKRIVYEAGNTTVKVGEEGSDVNPVDLVSNLLLRKGAQVRIDDSASAAAWNYYDSNGYLMNGYIEGSTRTNAAILEIMKESALMIFERAGNVVIKRRVLPVDAVSELYIFRGYSVKNGISVSHQSDDDCTNRITVRYNADASLAYASTYSAENADSIALIGGREEIAIDYPHVDLQAFAEMSANYWVERNTLPFRISDVQLFADAGQVIEYGDYITVSTAFSRIGEIFGEVVQISVDYAGKSSPTIYTITLTSGGTTNEPEYLWLEDEKIAPYEYLNLHPILENFETFYRPDTPAFFNTQKPTETFYRPDTPAFFNTQKPTETFYRPDTPAYFFNADQANETFYRPDTPAYFFNADQANETFYRPDTPAFFNTQKPTETVLNGDTAASSFTALPTNETVLNGDTAASSFTALPTNETFYGNDDGINLNTVYLSDTLVPVDNSGSVVFFPTNAWNEFTWGEAGHFWGKNP